MPPGSRSGANSMAAACCRWPLERPRAGGPFLDLEHGVCYDKTNHWNALTDGREKYIYHASTAASSSSTSSATRRSCTTSRAMPPRAPRLKLWRERMVAHLAPRGEAYVKGGRLVPRPDELSTSPNFPGCSCHPAKKKGVEWPDEDRDRAPNLWYGCASLRHKQRVALSSLLAAIGLTTFKMVVGLLTGSLGILAEAAHSGLDLAAAGATWFAVRISSKPADAEHPYGHGKVENLSALFEMGLLLLTCAWIVWAAVRRLWMGFGGGGGHGMVIRGDVHVHRGGRSRSRALSAPPAPIIARRWKPTPCTSRPISGVRLGGDRGPGVRQDRRVVPRGEVAGARRRGGRAGGGGDRRPHHAAPRHADGDGAVGHGAQGACGAIARAAESVPGVIDCHHVRLRYSGPQLFVDAHVTLEGNQTLASAHAITEDVERAVELLAPEADVTVHAEPPEAPAALERRRAGRSAHRAGGA